MTAWRLRVGHGHADTNPVLLEGEEASSRGAVVRALRQVGLRSDVVFVDGVRWSADDDRAIADSRLCNGSLVTELDDPEPVFDVGTYVVATGGPAAGASARLEVGIPVVVGRRPDGNGLVIADDLVSSEHFTVELGDDGIVRATDLGSRNGSFYEGEVFDVTIVEPGCLVRAGSSLFAVVTVVPDDRAIIRGTTPTGLNLHRQFREALSELAPVPKPPTEPRDPDQLHGTPWWRSLMPLVTAVGMAWMFGRWEFLLIAAFSPIVYALDNQRRKRRTRQTAARERVEYERALERHRTTLAERRATEVRRARTRFIGGGQASLLAQLRHRRVWERRPDDPDFLAVTLGHAGLASAFRDEPGSASATLWQAPLSISLLVEGPLSISGPPERAAAVMRSLISELTFTHAPVDVHLWVFSDEDHADEWQFVQWLPHAFTDDGGALLATTSTGRSTLMKALKGLIETRREEAEQRDRGLMVPLQIVVIDGVDNVSPPDLAQILRFGPGVGVVGIVSDPSVVPEGIRGEVRLGRFDDECTYRSEETPRVDGVVVSQVSPEIATAAAQALSPLEAFGKAGSSRPIGAVYFTELVRFGDRSGDEQLQFWLEHGPRTAVPVGVDMDGQPFQIDIVKHGPHGLVGGMTRSGKTEFLKTLFSSLAMHNHPDDLALAIIDFKGGVDHQQTARLPHVVVLATNQDIDLFERTVTLIAAEQQRRQRLFRDVAGVATIEGYRTARETRPDLVPMPRLLVIVDEFVELLSTPEGHAQIGRLEQIARIGAGLGVHLLLVTQDFTATLPAQIDGQAGLRVCFKVAKPSDSKTVLLGSGIASTISGATKGRGYARFMGGDLMEFQSARIGNQARALAVDDDQVVAHHVTADTLTEPPEPPETKEVPNEQQDLYRVVEVARAAAARSGFRTSAVPWPDDLPVEVGLVDLYERFPDDRRLLIGIADEPMKQRSVPVRHSFTDAVVAYAGAGDSGHHEALLVTAAAAATSCSPDDLHVYGIDLVGRGLSQIEPLPHVGGVATKDDATGVRMLNWLVAETARRRATISRFGASDFASYVEMGGADLPQIMLLVLGIDRMILHAEGGSSPLLQPMTTVLNEVTGTGIQVVFSGTHMMLTNRFGTVSSRRLVFAANDPGEYPATVPKHLRSQLTVPGRCIDSASNLLAQIGRVNLDGDGEGARDAVTTRDLFLGLAELVRSRGPAPTRPPKPFVRAPWPLHLSDIGPTAHASKPRSGSTPLPLGVRPDTGELFWVDPSEDGTAYRIVGGPKSGRSNALAAIALLAKDQGWDVLASVVSQRSSMLAVEQLQPWLLPIDDVVDRVSNGVGRPTLVVIDDAHRLDDEFPWKKFAASEGAVVVTVIAGTADGLTKPQFNARGLGVAGGAVLMPAKARDAAAVGVSTVDDDWVLNPLPGVGVAGIASEAHKIQFPLVVP